jgi:hypothetical protein
MLMTPIRRAAWPAVFTAALFAGCTYVSETPEALKVRVVTPAEASGCQSLGRITVNVPKMLRGERYVREDAMTLARKQAAKNGADTIAAVSPLVDGEQTFEMYRCIRP